MRRFEVSLLSLVLLGGLVACSGGSSLDNSGVPVFLTVEIKEHNPDINICSGYEDLIVTKMVVTSKTKDPTGEMTSNQDVNIRDWDVTPVRIDGGTVTSPDYHYQQAVLVAAGAVATLENYRVYPAEFLQGAPFNYLLPDNGGFDPETGADSVRETLNLVMSGRTVSGKQISTPSVPIGYRFYCN